MRDLLPIRVDDYLVSKKTQTGTCTYLFEYENTSILDLDWYLMSHNRCGRSFDGGDVDGGMMG